MHWGKAEGQEEEIGNFVSPKVRAFLCIMIMCKEIYAYMFFEFVFQALVH